MGAPPPVAHPPMMASGGVSGPGTNYGRGGPAPFGGTQGSFPSVGRGGGDVSGSVSGGGGFNAYPPFQPGSGRFEIGRGGGSGVGRGFSGRMGNGDLGNRRGDGDRGRSGGRGREGGRGIGAEEGRRAFDSGRGGGRTGGGRSSDGGRGGGGSRSFDGSYGRGGGRTFDAGRGGRSFAGGRGGGGRSGFDGGRGGGRGGRFGGSSRGDLDNIVLPKQDFGTLVPFEKSFYIESPSVQAMSEQEAMLYRARLEITVEGYDVPKPIRHFREANFPGISWWNIILWKISILFV